ncbi:hypothetical protein CCHL11_09093 [Colletotrichum chlorophyti]|uniref:Transcription factor domain-containing protein n=1 Tax=Colletotrichum chlorophyti TaxID=708187 RepID=A0A1Q8RSZ9_9PEZI|nr:hypothetical protein CCHL11_09093 [Colletotrichum chlorophyti]
MDGAAVYRDYSNGHYSKYLVRAICLVTCKARQATPFLRLNENGPVLEPLDFASKLLNGLDAALKADLEPDRIIKIQTLALMHLHNDGLSGVDRSSNYLSQAICNAWSVSLHVKVPVNEDQERCDFLWWALRNFDRLNKPVMGASPFMIDDTDIAIDRIVPSQDNYRSQLMAMSLELGDLMKTATKVYKASSTATVDECHDFPSFMDLASGIYLDRFHRSHKAYLEIWYHVAAMLSCRFSGPGSVHYTRRLDSANSVLGIISYEGPDSLPPLPLVPYAMSMSTTVIYRALRDGVRHPEVAYNDLGVCCDNLDFLSQRWTSAKGVARLTKRLRRYIKPGTLNGQRVEIGDCSCPAVRSEPRGLSRINQSSTSSSAGGGASAQQFAAIPVSDLLQCQEHMRQETPQSNTDDLQGQALDSWLDAGPSYVHLDQAFYDFFDYGMPNVFRDPATWDFLHTESNPEVSPLGAIN